MEPAARARLGVPRGRPGRHREVIGAVLSGERLHGAPSGTIVYTNHRRTIQMPCSLRFVYTPASPRLSTTAQQPNSVHKRPKTARRGPILPFVYTVAIPRPPTTQAHGPTVYTNAPKRPRGAISTDLCTLLRRRPGGEAHIAGVVTQPPPHTSSRSLYFRIRLRLCPEPSRFRHPTFPKQNRDLDHDSSFADFSPLSLRGEVSVCPSAYRLECSSYAQHA